MLARVRALRKNARIGTFFDEESVFMANVGSVLREEIVRLARRELRVELEPLKKFRTEQRHIVAGLKRELGDLRREVAQLRKGKARVRIAKDGPEPTHKLRFVAKGLKAQRARLGLSASDYGRLVGVTHQTVRNWEEGHTRPSDADLAYIDRLRHTSKKDAHQALESSKPARKKKAA